MKKQLFLALLVLVPAALTLGACNEEGARRAIEANGFKKVELAGTPFFGCGDSDSVFYNTKFVAIGANGARVEGVACSAPLKGWTVRIY